MTSAEQYGRPRWHPARTALDPSDPGQRHCARYWLDRCGFDGDLISESHAMLFTAARLEPRTVGRNVDLVLSEMNRGEVARLVAVLQEIELGAI